jgi:hypothetical protein
MIKVFDKFSTKSTLNHLDVIEKILKYGEESRDFWWAERGNIKYEVRNYIQRPNISKILKEDESIHDFLRIFNLEISLNELHIYSYFQSISKDEQLSSLQRNELIEEYDLDPYYVSVVLNGYCFWERCHKILKYMKEGCLFR